MSENSNVSATQIKTEVNNMRSAAKGKKSIADNLKSEMAQSLASLKAMQALDGQECERIHVISRFIDEDGKENPGRDDVKLWKLEIHPDLQTLEDAYRKFDIAHEQYTTDYNSFMKQLDEVERSAEEIEKQLNEITDSLDNVDDKDDTEDTDDPDDLDDTYTGGGVGGGGDYGGGGSGGGASYTPPVYNTEIPVTEEDDDTKEKEDYGDGDEGEEKDPVSSTSTNATTPYTLPSITSLITPTATPSNTTTPANTSTSTTTTGTAPIETHSGGGYSGGGEFAYDAPAVSSTNPEEEKVQEEIASSIDNIISNKSTPKIPTSAVPIAKVNTTKTKSSGSSVIPAASGIAAAAVIGLGAKAYLDKKKTEEEAEEEEQML